MGWWEREEQREDFGLSDSFELVRSGDLAL